MAATNLKPTGAFGFDGESRFNVSSANDIATSAHLERIVQLVNKVLQDDQALLKIFRDTAIMFGNELDDETIIKCIKKAAGVGYNYSIESSSEIKAAYMQCVPNKMRDPEDLAAHTVCFNETYINLGSNATCQEAERCVFFHFIKALHEVVHSFTPAFVRATTAFKNAVLAGTEDQISLDTLPNIGMAFVEGRTVLSDCGSALEQHLLGGRLTTQSTRKPFSKEVTIIAVRNACEAPRVPVGEGANFKRIVVLDELLTKALASVEEWVPGTPFPDISLMQTGAEDTEADKPRSKRILDDGAADTESKKKKARASGGVQDDVESVAVGPVDEEFETLKSLGVALSGEQVLHMKKYGAKF